MRYTILLLTIFSLGATSICHAAISSGSIAFIGANSDEAEHFAFVVTSTIGSGEVIHFTDSSYGEPVNLTRFRWTEHLGDTPTPGPLSWTTNVTIPVGTVVMYDDIDNHFELINGTITGTVSGAEMTLGIGGENLFAYQGMITLNDIAGNYDGDATGVTVYGGGFLWGQASGNWQTTGVGNTANSYLPSSLTDGTSAIALETALDNVRYNGPRSFNSSAEILAALNTDANWTGGDTVVASPADFGGNFILVPEPSSVLVGALGILSLLRRRR